MPVVFLTLRFDEQMEHMVRCLWDRLDQHGVKGAGPPRHRPHITMAAYEVKDVDSVCAALPGLTERRTVFPLRLHSLGVFPETGTVFLAPHMTTALFAAHRELVHFASSRWGPLLFPDHLLPDAWNPHCTLAEGLSHDDAARVINLCQQHWRPIEGRAEAIGVLVLHEMQDNCEALYDRSGRCFPA